jgi:hypothetical protein
MATYIFPAQATVVAGLPSSYTVVSMNIMISPEAISLITRRGGKAAIDFVPPLG